MVNRSRQIQKELALIRVARGESPADLVIRDARWLNVFTRSFETGDIAVFDGRIAGVGGRYEGKEVLSAPGQFVVPGLIDAHIHLESTLVTPVEFAGPALSHGTTAVICDPHEIANVMGEDGIRYMLEATKGIGLDVFLMLPSCVPATPFDESGASLDAAALSPFYRHARVLGLAEMMDYVGAACDPAVVEKSWMRTRTENAWTGTHPVFPAGRLPVMWRRAFLPIMNVPIRMGRLRNCVPGCTS